MERSLFIPGDFPSFKNSKQFVRPGLLINSAAVRKYLAHYEHHWANAENKQTFWELVGDSPFPIYLGMFFHRRTKGRCDLNNLTAGVTDLIVEHWDAPDDDYKHIIPLALGAEVRKSAPGVTIFPLKQSHRLLMQELLRRYYDEQGQPCANC